MNIWKDTQDACCLTVKSILSVFLLQVWSFHITRCFQTTYDVTKSCCCIQVSNWDVKWALRLCSSSRRKPAVVSRGQYDAFSHTNNSLKLLWRLGLASRVQIGRHMSVGCPIIPPQTHTHTHDFSKGKNLTWAWRCFFLFFICDYSNELAPQPR